jgi:hypothetical protein
MMVTSSSFAVGTVKHLQLPEFLVAASILCLEIKTLIFWEQLRWLAVPSASQAQEWELWAVVATVAVVALGVVAAEAV